MPIRHVTLLWRLETMAMMSDVDLPAAHIRNSGGGCG